MNLETIDRACHAIADPTRRAIIDRLTLGPARVTDIAAPFRMSLPAVSKHVRVLEDAGLVRRERRGREHRIHLEARPLREVHDWVAEVQEFWEQRLDALEEFLEKRPPMTEKKQQQTDPRKEEQL